MPGKLRTSDRFGMPLRFCESSRHGDMNAGGEIRVSMADDDEEPSAQAARVVVGTVIVLISLMAIILSFVTQTTLVRALEFGAAIVNFVLGIVVIVL